MSSVCDLAAGCLVNFGLKFSVPDDNDRLNPVGPLVASLGCSGIVFVGCAQGIWLVRRDNRLVGRCE